MADTILNGDLTIYYSDENRRKQIRWTGGALKTDVQKMIDIYDAVQDLFTAPTQLDDGIIFSGETPAEYTIGKIDAGEIDPWFIDLETMEHVIGDYQNFTGCALKTSGWTRSTGTNTGIVVVAVTSGGAIVKGDIGNDISHVTDSDAGTLLDVVITGGSTDYLFIRPDSNAAANNFDSASGNLSCNAHTSAQSSAAVTGEMVWGNVFTQGAIDPETHVYMFQGGARLTANDATDQDWWPDGQIDRAVPITDYTSASFPTLDDGYLQVFARQYSFSYSYATIRMNTTSGGAVSAPLSSGADLNNTTGYWTATTGAHTGTFQVGEEITTAAGEKGVLTAVVVDTSLTWYQTGDPLDNFDNTDAVTGSDSSATCTLTGAPTATGPANLTTDPTLTFANTQVDIDDVGGAEPYGITIDVNQNTLADMYEFLKYITRRGSTTDLDGLDGQEYIGIDFRVNYTSITGTIAEGATVTGVTSGATGIVVSHDLTNDVALLRNTRGEFQSAEQIQVDGSNYWASAGLTATAITPVAEMPFGTLAGGVFFGAVGVVLTDYQSGEENSFILKDANGVQRQRPTSISMTISNLLQYDWASTFRLTGSGGSVDKTEYSATGGEAIGAATLVVDTAITADTPGKTTGGRLVVRDASDDNAEYVLRYSSWATSTFTLANTVVTAEAGTDTNTIVDTGVMTAANVQVGDLVLNTTRSNAISYVTERTDDNTIQIDPPITGQTTADAIEINAIPVAINTADDVYVPIIMSFCESGQTEKSASMQYVATIYGRTRVRNTSAATTKIKPFTSDVTIGLTGGATTAVRTTDPVYGS